jgi:hypothetical protein
VDQQWLRIARMKQVEAEQSARNWRLPAQARPVAPRKPAGLWLGEWLHGLAHGLLGRYGGETEHHATVIRPNHV